LAGKKECSFFGGLIGGRDGVPGDLKKQTTRCGIEKEMRRPLKEVGFLCCHKSGACRLAFHREPEKCTSFEGGLTGLKEHAAGKVWDGAHCYCEGKKEGFLTFWQTLIWPLGTHTASGAGLRVTLWVGGGKKLSPTSCRVVMSRLKGLPRL